ncbi:MAG: aspartate aminotransferase family protein, partial [Candidatus Acidiferrales bacterium]
RLFRDQGMLAQMCGNNFSVLKVAPPLVLKEEQAEEFVSAVRKVMELVHTSAGFWMDALEIGRRAMNI